MLYGKQEMLFVPCLSLSLALLGLSMSHTERFHWQLRLKSQQTLAAWSGMIHDSPFGVPIVYAVQFDSFESDGVGARSQPCTNSRDRAVPPR